MLKIKFWLVFNAVKIYFQMSSSIKSVINPFNLTAVELETNARDNKKEPRLRSSSVS